MTKLLPHLAVLISCTAAFPIATQAQPPAPREVIEIEVAPEDLDRCRETLAQVIRPALPADSHVTEQPDPTLATVVCIAKV